MVSMLRLAAPFGVVVEALLEGGAVREERLERECVRSMLWVLN